MLFRSLHDYFIARSIARLRPGGVALFVTSTGTMDKAGTVARKYIAGMADLVGAVRLPEGSMRASAGTDVVIDLLVFQRRADGQPAAGAAWIGLAVATRNDVRPDAQSRVVFDAQSVRLSAIADARSVRLNARSLRRTRDRKSRRTLVETHSGISPFRVHARWFPWV